MCQCIRPFCRSDLKICLVCPCLPLVCLQQGFPPSNTGTYWLLSGVVLLDASPSLPLFTCVNVRPMPCACIVRYATVHLWIVYLLAKQSNICNVKNPAFSTTTCCSIFSECDQMVFGLKDHLTDLNICCLGCVDCTLLESVSASCQVIIFYLLYLKLSS